MKIAVMGTGYVGLSLATLLSQNNEVYAFDIDQDKVDKINKRIAPIEDDDLKILLQDDKLNLKATLNCEDALKDADFVIICTPTNYNSDTNNFDTSIVEDCIQKTLEISKESTIVIKSTIPIGFTSSMKEKYNTNNILFSPEFLREGKGIYDNIYPSRIIIGDKGPRGREFAKLVQNFVLKEDVKTIYMDSTEAEAVKLFVNTYLALRVCYFNELDTFAELKNLNTRDIIEGICLDPRVGHFYNNPSFGYGGYCLPKDTKELQSNYRDIPNNIISSIDESNTTRKKHIADMIITKFPGSIIGIYRLSMKQGSDNYRQSAMLDIIEELKKRNVQLLIYEPTIESDKFNGIEVCNDFAEFNQRVDVIVDNRMDDKLKKVKEKVYTRDLFARD